jgi:ankyrin repeat protein
MNSRIKCHREDRENLKPANISTHTVYITTEFIFIIVFKVVELLLLRGANKEHRNVSDYTPLSLAASGGFVNIIKLLLSHGAEINSRLVYLVNMM